MPTCKNDSSSYYKGTEPSPKGLGYVAHAEKVNKRRKGKDGKFWIVKTARRSGTTKRIKRWVRVASTKPKKKKKMTTKVKGGMMSLGLQSNPFLSKPKRTPKQTKPKPDLKRLAELCHKSNYIQQLTQEELQEFDQLAKHFKLFKYHELKGYSRRNMKKLNKIAEQLKEDEYHTYDMQEGKVI